MERKIADQNKVIESLYEDLESREKFIEMLQEDLKDTNRKNVQGKKKWEAEREVLDDKLKVKTRMIEDLKSIGNIKCPKGCEKYSKSVDEIFEAGVEHKEKLVALKEIADNQKSKIFCLRKHRDEIADKLEDLEVTFSKELAAKDAIISSHEAETKFLKNKVKDFEDEIKSDVRSTEIR